MRRFSGQRLADRDRVCTRAENSYMFIYGKPENEVVQNIRLMRALLYVRYSTCARFSLLVMQRDL